MMSPAFFDPIPPLLLFSNFWSPQTTSRPDKSFKFQARTRSLDQNFTKANFHGTKDWVCCQHCVICRGRRRSRRPFEGVLENEADQGWSLCKFALTNQNSHNYQATQHQQHISIAIKSFVSKILRCVLKCPRMTGLMLLARWLAGVWSKRGRLLAEFPRETLLVGHHHPLSFLLGLYPNTFLHSIPPLRPLSWIRACLVILSKTFNSSRSDIL